jgi:UDP-N-acetyl-D-glucosamine dehydrogenase
MSSILERALHDRTATIAVIGQGYVGLPIAVAFAQAGFSVFGIDRDAAKIAELAAGRSYVEDVRGETIAGLVASGRFRPRSGFDEIGQCRAVVICVPTPLSKTGDPDISFIMESVASVAPRIVPPALIVLESTSYPGTTREILVPALTQAGFTVGADVFVAFSPERIDPGNSRFGFTNTPKVLGGVTPECTRMASALYSQAVERVVPVSSPETAEMTKLLENTFRMVNVALVNEVAVMCDHLGIDAWEVIGAASTKPFGFMPFYPGPGLGGHCLPVDPHYLAWKLRMLDYHSRFIALAEEINAGRPYQVVEKVAGALNLDSKAVNGATILALGASYKAGIGDIRESPALKVIWLLMQRGAHVRYHDPHVPSIDLGGTRLDSVELSPAEIEGADCTVILTAHPGIDYAMVAERSRKVVDMRNATAGIDLPGIIR